MLFSENAAHHGDCARRSQAVSNEQVIYKRRASSETKIFSHLEQFTYLQK